MLIWLPAIVSFLVSIAFLIVRTFQFARKRPVELLKIKFIRPALVVLLWIVIGRYHKASAKQADSYAIALAKNFQGYCDSNGFCVASIPGWSVSTGLLDHSVYYSTNVQTLGISYPLRYTSDGRAFEVILVHGFNMELCVKGGIGSDLKATYYDEGGQVQIPVDYQSQHLTTNTLYLGK